jgi:hypothetical protein
MSRVRFVSLATLLLATCIQADQKCVAICPDFVVPLEKSVNAIILHYLNGGGPSDGFCEKGDKFFLDGQYFGQPGNIKCACSFLIKSQYGECAAGVPECSIVPNLYKGELARDFQKRIGQEFKDTGVPDGCCRPGYYRYIARAEDVGLDRNLCYCSPFDNPTVIAGKPESISDFEA